MNRNLSIGQIEKHYGISVCDSLRDWRRRGFIPDDFGEKSKRGWWSFSEVEAEALFRFSEFMQAQGGHDYQSLIRQYISMSERAFLGNMAPAPAPRQPKVAWS